MKYKLFGKSGLRVSELCLGVLTFGEERSYGAPKEECRRILNAYAEAGGNFIDTSDIYMNGTSEKWLGELIASDRDYFVVSTKYTNSTRPGDPNACGNHRKHMMQALDASLKRLNTDYIDIYWLHAWDFTTPIEEVLRALDDAISAGKVLYAGLSNTPAWIVSRANAIAELRSWAPFLGVQVRYSLVDRTAEREYFDMAHELDMAVACWQPLGASLLTGDLEELKIRTESPGNPTRQPSERDINIAKNVADIAKQIDRSPAQVALNWIRQQKCLCIPVVGARKVEHIKDNLCCLDFTLTDEQMKQLDNVSSIDFGYPYNVLQDIYHITFGGMSDSIDNHRR